MDLFDIFHHNRARGQEAQRIIANLPELYPGATVTDAKAELYSGITARLQIMIELKFDDLRDGEKIMQLINNSKNK